jgi:hypothetical protein
MMDDLAMLAIFLFFPGSYCVVPNVPPVVLLLMFMIVWTACILFMWYILMFCDWQ